MVINNMMQKLTEQEQIEKDILIRLFDETFNAGALLCADNRGYPVLSAKGRLPSVLGYETEDALLREAPLFTDLVFEEDLDSVLSVLQQVADGKNSFSIEFRCRHRDGTALSLCGAVIYLTHTGHLLLSFIKTAETIWDRIFRLLPCGICRVAGDDDFTILQANEIYYDIYGYTSKEAQAAGFTNERFIIHPDDYEHVLQKVRRCLNTMESTIFEMEHRVVMKDGSTGWVLVKGYVDKTAESCCLNCVLLDISDRKIAEENLRISEEQSRIAFLSTDNLMDIYDVQTHILEHPYDQRKDSRIPKHLENVPYSVIAAGQVEGGSINDYIQLFDSMNKGVPEGQRTILMKQNKEDDFGWYEIKYRMIFDKSGAPERAVLSYKDITSQREKELAYEKWSRFFDQQKRSSLGYYEYNLTKNQYAGSENNLLDSLPAHIQSFTGAVRYYSDTCVYEEDREKYRKFYHRERLLAAYYSGTMTDDLEYRRIRDSGEVFWAAGTIQLIPDPYTEDIRVFILVQDIDREVRQRIRIKSQLETDFLTALPNRGTAIKRIRRCLQEKDPLGQSMLAMLDVDHFKEINDSYGHQSGDQVLSSLGRIMSSMIKEEDVCGRMGGDEFILFLTGIPSPEQAGASLRQILDSLNRTYHFDAAVSVSIGAVYPCNGQSFESLYELADSALYEAKKGGRGRFVLKAIP